MRLGTGVSCEGLTSPLPAVPPAASLLTSLPTLPPGTKILFSSKTYSYFANYLPRNAKTGLLEGRANLTPFYLKMEILRLRGVGLSL